MPVALSSHPTSSMPMPQVSCSHPCLPFLILFTTLTTIAHASVTIYGKPLYGSALTSSQAQTTAAAFNDSVLRPPLPPTGQSKSPDELIISLPLAESEVFGLSIEQTCAFWGFSIEMSVVAQVLGKNSSLLQVPFLNLMENIVQRGGCVRVRTGGNTQEFARYTNELPPDSNKSVVVKENVPGQNPTETPTLLYNLDYFYLLGNISALVNIGWFLGIPLNDTSLGAPIRLEVAEYGQQILGDRLLGLQVGNEPDLYAAHGHRPPTYTPYDYFNEFGSVAEAVKINSNVGPLKNDKLIGPSVATGTWTPEMVWDTGFIDSYSHHNGGMLGALAVEHYPDDDCFALYGPSLGQPKDVQAIFSDFLNHTSAQILLRPYLNSSSIAVSSGLPLYMFETNTASCGGFPGISDSFGATLWALDYGLQMAWGNFSGGLIHVGGRSVYYNPFTPPPTNESLVHQWTIGATYYSALVTAEVFGASNKSRIVDLQRVSNPSIYQPQYAIYEGGQLARITLFNFLSDDSGNSDYTAILRLDGRIDRVYVKYLLSDSVSTKNNITWGGQTLGTKYTVDGRLRPSSPTIYTVICTVDETTSERVCRIKVPAPSFVLVSLPAFPPFPFVRGSSTVIEAKTFNTTTRTKTRNTATIDPSVLATSNGSRGKGAAGSTSKTNSVGWRFEAASFTWLMAWAAFLASCL